ncbi:MAG: UDP-N-acetylmuramoyl-L-alanine--D-glutamate ligase [Desulfobacteraceae bacterium 4572_130]|nr:MAG: UDP-N-acetylmuramoyl-L-alanine--D-glutamate ligase [Desulfobacteraceae bacterium 4572_130]
MKAKQNKFPNTDLKSQKNKYILVAGLGKSGFSIAQFLNTRGFNVLVTDIDSSKKKKAQQLEKQGIKTEIGFHKLETFENAEKIVTSPGIPLNFKYFKRALEKKVPIIGELDLVAEYIKQPIIAITGTNGKTTVTCMITEMLKASGFKVFTGGNIGIPLLEYFNEKEKKDIIVAEVSSFQLDTVFKFAPKVALLLNITRDHLDRYTDLKAYAGSKWSIFKNQTHKDTAIINNDIYMCEKEISKLKSKCVFFGKKTKKNGFKGCIIESDKIRIYDKTFNQDKEEILDISNFHLKGMHNRENIAASCLAVLAVGGTIKGIKKGLENFSGLSHRIEYVKTINGVEYYNDSKATNPDAVLRALESFKDNIILIMGGKEKNTDFSYIRDIVKKKVKKIIVIGEAKQKIAKSLSLVCEIFFADSMKHAVNKAFQLGIKKDIVLLSPACASFDMYENYAQRGHDFVKHIKALKRK